MPHDGGHLNEFGSKVVAYNLLAFLAEELKLGNPAHAAQSSSRVSGCWSLRNG